MAALTRVLERVRPVLLRIGPFLPDFKDVHVYLGGLLLAVGAGSAWSPAGPMVAGAFLLYLGLRK